MTPLFILIIVAIFLVAATPVFVIGKRSGLRNPWAAFILLLGVWIVLFEAIGRSGWLSLLVFIPTAGPLIALLWTGVELPAQHGRSRWWTLPPDRPVRQPARVLVLRVHAAARRALVHLGGEDIATRRLFWVA